MAFNTASRILITGGTGSFGQAFIASVEQLRTLIREFVDPAFAPV